MHRIIQIGKATAACALAEDRTTKKEEKEKGGNDEEGDSRRTRRRVFDNAEISQQGVNEPRG